MELSLFTIKIYFLLGSLVMIGSFDLLWSEDLTISGWLGRCLAIWLLWPIWTLVLIAFAIWLIRRRIEFMSRYK